MIADANRNLGGADASSALALDEALHDAVFERMECDHRQASTRRKHVDPTVAHRNHIHIGLNNAGATRRTSFWSAAR